MEIKKIGIIGAGTMGNGIAQAFAVCGYDVTMTDINEAAVQRGLKTVDGSLERLVKKEKMTAEAKAAALGHIKTATEVNAVRGSDLIIEAATENLELKLKIFEQLAKQHLALSKIGQLGGTANVCRRRKHVVLDHRPQQRVG